MCSMQGGGGRDVGDTTLRKATTGLTELSTSCVCDRYTIGTPVVHASPPHYRDLSLGSCGRIAPRDRLPCRFIEICNISGTSGMRQCAPFSSTARRGASFLDNRRASLDCGQLALLRSPRAQRARNFSGAISLGDTTLNTTFPRDASIIWNFVGVRACRLVLRIFHFDFR